MGGREGGIEGWILWLKIVALLYCTFGWVFSVSCSMTNVIFIVTHLITFKI